METLYRVDGKIYTSREDAEKAEKELIKQQEATKIFSEKREAKAKEVQDAWVNYARLKGEYEEEYGKPIMDWAEFFRSFFE